MNVNQWNRHILVLMFGFSLLLGCIEELDAQIDDNNEASILEAALANEAAWTAGDLLIEIDVSADSTELHQETQAIKGGLYKCKTLIRVLFDFENEQGACYQLMESELSNFNEALAEKQFSQDWAAVNYSKKTASAKCFTKAFGTRETDYEAFVRQSDPKFFYPIELRGFWLTNRMLFGQHKQLKNNLNIMLQLPDDLVAYRKAGRKLSLTVKTVNKLGVAEKCPVD